MSFLLLIMMCTLHNVRGTLSPEARSLGFVYLHEVDPTIQTALRYCGSDNFLGEPVSGYKRPVTIMTQQAAAALKKVQQYVKRDGYRLVVYDAYRPQQAVNHFVRWASEPTDQKKKSSYYPRIDKAHVFELGYVAQRSGHSRGSTVDVTLIRDGQSLQDVRAIPRTLLDGFTIRFLDDGTVDMGSSFDLFDTASHYESNLIASEYRDRRAYLRRAMEYHGFKGCATEWWHFTLKDEPFPADKASSYFNFPIK